MVYFLSIALVLVTFLWVLNGFLRGARKAQINNVLILLLIGLISTAFFEGGWKIGFFTIAIASLSTILFRPIAARLASKLFASSTNDGGSYVGLPPRNLYKISKQLGKPIDFNKTIEEIRSGGIGKKKAEEVLYDYCEEQPAIQAVLKDFKVTRQGLRELYRQLIAVGAGQWVCGHWVAASALAYPESLKYLLERENKNWQETAYSLIMYFEQGSPLEP